MNREDFDDQEKATPPEPAAEPSRQAPITPGEEPSALERGARIFERLRRRLRD